MEGCSDSSVNSAELRLVRNELNNVRKTMRAMKCKFLNEVKRLESLLEMKVKSNSICEDQRNTEEIRQDEGLVTQKSRVIREDPYHLIPIGHIETLHKEKNGIPRQGSFCSWSHGILRISKKVFTNPQHSLQGLAEFSHVWLLFIFHANNSVGIRAKIAPPRLNGLKVGVFASRSPHRPNPIGLTLAKLDKVDGEVLHLSGIDLLDGTPIVDVKPYIPSYDHPDCPTTNYENTCRLHPSSNITEKGMKIENSESNDIDSSTNDSKSNVRNVESRQIIDSVLTSISHKSKCSMISIADWVNEASCVKAKIVFSPVADDQIRLFSQDATDTSFKLRYLKNHRELREAIAEVLSEDPRSVYRKRKCADRLYYFSVDVAHITAAFFPDQIEVLRVGTREFVRVESDS